MKGMTEAVLDRSATAFKGDGVPPAPLSAADRDAAMQQAGELAARGLRVVAVAYGQDMEVRGPRRARSLLGWDRQRRLPAPTARRSRPNLLTSSHPPLLSPPCSCPHAQALTFVGFVGIMDPPRPGVAASVRRLIKNKVLVTMITGDARETACSIASSLGFFTAGRDMSVCPRHAPSDLRAPLSLACLVYPVFPPCFPSPGAAARSLARSSTPWGRATWRAWRTVSACSTASRRRTR